MLLFDAADSALCDVLSERGAGGEFTWCARIRPTLLGSSISSGTYGKEILDLRLFNSRKLESVRDSSPCKHL